MESTGTVQEFHPDAGWGVITSPSTPGGCWVHFSAIETPGYRTLTPGEQVLFEWEESEQDGHRYRATRVARGTPPAETPSSEAYKSTLTLTFDPPRPPPG